MKKEARILVSQCKDSVCVGYVIRYPGIDGFSVSARGCQGLCESLRSQGYLFEIRFYSGDCGCHAKQFTAKSSNIREIVNQYLVLAENIAQSIAGLLAHCKQGTHEHSS